jgi:hypothetical protein
MAIESCGLSMNLGGKLVAICMYNKSIKTVV